MYRLIYLFVALLLLVPMVMGGCVDQEEEPALPEKPVEEPVSPEKPDPSDDVQPWTEANQLEPEKPTILIIEGMEEELTLHLHVSSINPYAIYLDQERYRVEEGDNKDIIMFDTEAEIPEVSMAIWHREDIEVSQLAAELENQLKEQYTKVTHHGRVESPLPAQYIYAEKGDSWDDTVVRYYLVEDFNGGVFVVQQIMFLEAVEGHGVRFDGILEEFFIWDFEKGEFLRP